MWLQHMPRAGPGWSMFWLLKLYHLFPVIYYENSCDSFFGIGWLCHLKEEETS